MTGNSVDPQHPPFCLSCRETLLVFFRAASSSETKRNAVQWSFVP